MKKRIWEIAFVLTLLIGIIVCTMCDIALSGSYTWSLVPISSIIFGWVALYPIVQWGKKGIITSLAILVSCIGLYLYALTGVVKDDSLIISIGSRISVVSIIYFLGIFGIFKVLKKTKYTAIAISLLLGIPICIIINYSLSEMYSQPLFDIWDILAVFTLLILSIISMAFAINSHKKKK